MFDVGTRLKEFRTSQGLSMRKLANFAGVSQATVGDTEHNNKAISVVALEKICTALGITLVEFFTVGEKIPAVCFGEGHPEYNRICHLSRMLEPQELKIVLPLVEKLIDNRTKQGNGATASIVIEEYIKLLNTNK